MTRKKQKEKKEEEKKKRLNTFLGIYSRLKTVSKGRLDHKFDLVINEWLDAAIGGNLTRLFARQILLSIYGPFIEDLASAGPKDFDRLESRWGGDFTTGSFRSRAFGYIDKTENSGEGKPSKRSAYLVPSDLMLSPAVLMLNQNSFSDGEFNSTEADYERSKPFSEITPGEFDFSEDTSQVMCIVNLERSMDEIIHSFRKIKSEYLKRKSAPKDGVRGIDIDDTDILLFIAFTAGIPSREIAFAFEVEDLNFGNDKIKLKEALLQSVESRKEKNRKRIPELLAFVDPYADLAAEYSSFA